jgi:hypothetical protein
VSGDSDNEKKKIDIDFDEYVKIYSNDSKQITLLGSVFHNKKSRAMWLMLSSTDNEFYLKEMAVIIEKIDNPRLPIYEHHIGTMVESGIVLVRKKMHNKHMTKFYRAAPVILLTTPQLYEKATKSKTLKNVFNKVFKFAAIGVATFSTVLIHSYHLQENSWTQASDLPLHINETTILISSLVFTISLLISQNLKFLTKKLTFLKRLAFNKY